MHISVISLIFVPPDARTQCGKASPEAGSAGAQETDGILTTAGNDARSTQAGSLVLSKEVTLASSHTWESGLCLLTYLFFLLCLFLS